MAEVTEVSWWMLGIPWESVVFLNHWVEDGGEEGVSLSIWSVDTESRIQILNTRLDAIQQGRTERGLQVLDFVEDFTGQVLLQQRLGIGGGKLLESSFQFF